MVDKMTDGRQLGLVADHALQKAKIKKNKISNLKPTTTKLFLIFYKDWGFAATAK